LKYDVFAAAPVCVQLRQSATYPLPRSEQSTEVTMEKKRARIGLREVRALGRNEEIWDASVPGFGARRQRSEAVAYIILYRTREGRARRFTIGRHGAPWTPDTARDEARRLLGDVASGADPSVTKKEARSASTITELCDMYLADAESGRLLTRRKVAKKASTLLSDKGRVERHIKPLLGRLKVPMVTREDVEGFMHAVAQGSTAARTPTGKKRGLSNVRGGKGVATRTVGLLGAIFTYAIRKRLRPDNPVRGVTRFADQRRTRRLTGDEYRMLGIGLAAAAQVKAVEPGKMPRKADGGLWPAAIAAARFLALTGWRSGEALGLKWTEIDVVKRTARLPDTKTGLSVRPLSQAACDVLTGLAKGEPDALVFPPTRGKGRMSGFPSLFTRIVIAGGLPAEITPHVLRHSFASLAGDLGYSEPTVAALIGHQGVTVTSRYMHAADAVLLAAADAVAARTLELMAVVESETGLASMLSEERHESDPQDQTIQRGTLNAS
jgi:integrase